MPKQDAFYALDWTSTKNQSPKYWISTKISIFSKIFLKILNFYQNFHRLRIFIEVQYFLRTKYSLAMFMWTVWCFRAFRCPKSQIQSPKTEARNLTYKLSTDLVIVRRSKSIFVREGTSKWIEDFPLTPSQSVPSWLGFIAVVLLGNQIDVTPIFLATLTTVYYLESCKMT